MVKISFILFINLLPLFYVFGELTRHFKEFLNKSYGGDLVGQLDRMDMGGYLYGSFGGKEGDNDTIRNEPVIFVHGVTLRAGVFVSHRNYFLGKGYSTSELYATTYADGGYTPFYMNELECESVKQIREFIIAVHNYTEKTVDIIAYSMGVAISRKSILGGHCVDTGEFLGEPLTEYIDTFVSVGGVAYGMEWCPKNLPACNDVDGMVCTSEYMMDINQAMARYEGENSFAIYSSYPYTMSIICSEGRVTGFIAISTTIIIVCLTSFYLRQMIIKINNIRGEVDVGMDEFNSLQGNLWTDLLVNTKKRVSVLSLSSDYDGRIKKRQASNPNCDCINTAQCPPGPPGPAGQPGIDGEHGKPGEPGPAGEQALAANTQAPVDESCRVCPLGPQGLRGYPGPAGPPGAPGGPGLPGLAGKPGHPGQIGSPGEMGEQGMAGKEGMPGPPGLEGVRGTSGRQGEPGLAGMPGPKGYSGAPGRPGMPGLQGMKGEAGPEGPPGQPGWDGMRGQFGENGQPGPDASYCKCPQRLSLTGEAPTITSSKNNVSIQPNPSPPSYGPKETNASSTTEEMSSKEKEGYVS